MEFPDNQDDQLQEPRFAWNAKRFTKLLDTKAPSIRDLLFAFPHFKKIRRISGSGAIRLGGSATLTVSASVTVSTMTTSGTLS